MRKSMGTASSMVAGGSWASQGSPMHQEGREVLERIKPRRGRDFHADDGDERRACRDAQRLETRANDERRGRVGGICGRRLEINCFGEEGDASLIRSQKA